MLLLAAVLLFGASWPAVKLAVLATATPVWLAASRSGLACLTLTVLLLCAGRLHLPSRSDMPTVLAVGILQLTIFFLFCHFAVSFVPAGHTAILSNAALIWVVPLAAILGQREPLLRWFAAGVTLAGVVIIIGPWSIDWTDTGTLRGYASLLVAAFAWACTIMVTRARPPRMYVLELLPWAFAISTAALVTLAFALEPDGRLPVAAWPLAAFNGMVVAPLGTCCLIELSRRLTPTASAISFMIIPIMGVLFSMLTLGEAIDANLLFGAGMIAAGVVLTSRK